MAVDGLSTQAATFLPGLIESSLEIQEGPVSLAETGPSLLLRPPQIDANAASFSRSPQAQGSQLTPTREYAPAPRTSRSPKSPSPVEDTHTRPRCRRSARAPRARADKSGRSSLPPPGGLP